MGPGRGHQVGAFDTWSGHEVKSLASTARLNASVTHDLVKGRVAVLKPLDDSLPAEGEGRVGRRGLHSVVQSTVDGARIEGPAVEGLTPR